jgi:hypothetical protein
METHIKNPIRTYPALAEIIEATTSENGILVKR